MPSRGWLRGEEFAEEERQAEAMNESARRAFERASVACLLATERFAQDDDVEIIGRPEDPESDVYLTTEDGVAEYVDGGYWVEARVFVDADAVENRMQDEEWMVRNRPA